MKRDWSPSEEAFRRLLAWLDEGKASGGERYLDMRRRLTAYFERRGCRGPDDLVDETLNRVARRIEEEGVLPDGSPGRYCYIVAKFVFLEALRREKRVSGAELTAAVAAGTPAPLASSSGDAAEARLACLDRCLDSLRGPDRELILGYYAGGSEGRAGRRRQLASRLDLSPNALAIRACRIRDTLEDCVRSCMDGGA